MSMLTIGSVLYSKIPFIGPSAAAFITAFTCSTEAAFFKVHVKSVTEPSGIGTLIAFPFNLPFKWGNTNPTALAAPVLVGTMLYAAARARRKSLCGASAKF